MIGQIAFASLVASLLAAPGLAEEELPPPGPFAVGLKVGVVLAHVATPLGTAAGGELELSYRVWRGLSVFLSAGYTRPTVERTSVADPRLAGAYDGTQTQEELTTSLGLLYRFLEPASKWNAYAGLGGRLYFLKTHTEGNVATQPFGENTEQSTQVGAVVVLGGEVRLGPGALALEAQFGDSSLPHVITGDVSTGALAFDLGYRFSF